MSPQTKIDLLTQVQQTSSTYTSAAPFNVVNIDYTLPGVFGSSAVVQGGIYVQLHQVPPADTAILAVAVKGVVTLEGTHNFLFTGNEPSAGGTFFAFHEGSGHALQLAGAIIAAGTFGPGSGLLDTAWGLYAQTGPQASGPITNDYTVFIASPNVLGPMTNHWGLYIQDQTVGGANNPNPWAIYVEGGNTNLGPGKTSIGKLKVTGLLAFANNAAAIAGGLGVGDFYRTGANPDVVCVVH